MRRRTYFEQESCEIIAHFDLEKSVSPPNVTQSSASNQKEEGTFSCSKFAHKSPGLYNGLH